MNLYSKPMIHSFKKLETEGITININGNEQVGRGFLICGTADLPAKSLVMNCYQFNGAFSCMRCMDPGETFKQQRVEFSIYFRLMILSQSLSQERVKDV